MKYKGSVFRTFALISQLGISILVPVLLCTFFGSWLEKKVSFPVFVPLVIIGVLAGMRNAYYLVRHANEDPEDKKKEK
ncbi:AtpZ/AtpI family protein [Bariatricus massiliensis]|uniref:AtpZ/AtpI family protein n=1 Tax=Bariatricus massiliensis TaxID=1745713 RepID=A0ABS8DKM7_9FIRM|nr:AtpZ/AtpI family protein [Bariatricus massiliensis]MCB7305772.1 AtpZ/AtpI family protein [Bariatricus massiliensis]MCB7376311.1 AtpZ/AtpI family protein [Bariatricus massiliensis]MCB7388915.1 AtpZ/AtpI family protein [Bariatricus massiliensis]MCB7413088.1 AtpZ/AtpI family protein [Bariatricus massiliensis]MCQ5254967.1 AtpZ/AtpI family protein [Bariatricus massiliensis]